MGEVQSGGARSGPSWTMVIIVAVVAAAVIGALVGVIVVQVGSSDASALTLEPADLAGANPFTDSIATGGPVAFAPSATAANATTQASFTKDTKTGALVAPANAPGLYGGSGDTHVCNPQQIVDYLAHDPAKAKAWASVFGISTDDIASYVGSLTPVLLTSDTLVTNHGYHNGKATPLQSVLQTGTAVMVDTTGTPRVKCNCGNPLTPPDAITLSKAKLTGTAWPNYNITNFTTIQTTTQITTFVIINIQTGTTYNQPAPTTPTTPTDNNPTTSGMWVAASISDQAASTTISTSSDGSTWTTAAVLPGPPVTGLTWGAGKWLAVRTPESGQGTTVLESTDLHTWTPAATIADGINDVAYGDGHFLGIGYSNDITPGSNVARGVVYSSTDGTTWTKEEGDPPAAASIAFGNGTWITTSFIKGDYGEWALERSTDGKTWPDDGGSSPENVFEDMAAYGGGQWLVGGQPSLIGAATSPTYPDGAMSASPDGRSWSPVAAGQFPMNAIAGLAYGNGMWMAVAKDGTHPNGIHGNPSSQFFTSTDGRTWSKGGHLDTEPTELAFGGTASTASASGPTDTTVTSGPPCTVEALQAGLNASTIPSGAHTQCDGTWAGIAGVIYNDGDEGNALLRADGDAWQSGGSCTDPGIPPDIFQVACTSS